MGVKGHAGVTRGQAWVKLLTNALWSPNLVRKTHGQSVKGHAVVDWGQPDTNCPETHKPANVANVALTF